MNVTISGPRQSAADVFGAFRELVAELGDLVGQGGNFQHIIHDYGHV